MLLRSIYSLMRDWDIELPRLFSGTIPALITPFYSCMTSIISSTAEVIRSVTITVLFLSLLLHPSISYLISTRSCTIH